ncbi:hypothetical protein NLM27_20100 [Bradyrhizobium sp. CCGB12]|uniref:hypothetical protein n=1 Tax=Bradyrhizobium sp. CCGB12 TaxID=2949632 RepID=UPI0020B2CCA1|nr:hypothetical protein [Bradyrhizobium sp. CCGB12]MCP3391089.1 hypothetical protein [Bradyrhizobium sp. CCGB12]
MSITADHSLPRDLATTCFGEGAVGCNEPDDLEQMSAKRVHVRDNVSKKPPARENRRP